jgi:hypothetical protein
MLENLANISRAKTGRCSSWDRTGRNRDCWTFEPGLSRVLAEIEGARPHHAYLDDPAEPLP